jgi:DNA polymerase III delta prime subunit
MAEKLKTLDQVIGQQNIVKWFASCIQRDKMPQVIMLQGPAGIGKTSIAKIVACEIAYMNNPEKLEAAKVSVIDESKSTDCVRLYNMSNLKSQEAVTEVKSDLTIGFSSTGRKVIIMDEAHGMSDEAQDSLLTSFESLQNQVYIIICSTELESFRDAFLSRCVLRRLKNLSQGEMRTFLKRRIEENNLKFELSLPMVYTLIGTYTGREPRRAINLLDSFEEGSTVTVQELETFFNVYEGKQLLTLVDYLYGGNILSGLEFIVDMDMSSTFQSTLLEIVRVAENGQSTLLSVDAVLHLRSLVDRDGINNLLGFAIDCTTHGRITRSAISGYFLKWCSKSNEIFTKPERSYPDAVQLEDISMMQNMLEERDIHANANSSDVMAKSLDMLMAESDTLEDQ